MSLKETGLIEKRNVLNEVRKNYMSLQELRFFSIYLSRINARDLSTRLVRFSLRDFQKIMGFGKLNRAQLEDTTNKLLGKVLNIPNERGGYTGFTIFKKCHVDIDDQGEWYIEIEASDDALPLMFDFKKEYFTYRLWNALRLKSANQIRMYEILKQYEKIGQRELSVEALRDLIGIEKRDYPRWDNFRREVLDTCQKALEENTDICYTYRRGKTGRGGKWLTVIFDIRKNDKYVDQLSIEEFLSDGEPENEPHETVIEPINNTVEPVQEPSNKPVEPENEPIYDEEIEMLLDLGKGMFSVEEIKLINALLLERYPSLSAEASLHRADLFIKKLRYMEYQETKHKINNHFGYMKRLLELELESAK